MIFPHSNDGVKQFGFFFHRRKNRLFSFYFTFFVDVYRHFFLNSYHRFLLMNNNIKYMCHSLQVNKIPDIEIKSIVGSFNRNGGKAFDSFGIIQSSKNTYKSRRVYVLVPMLLE